MAAQPASFENCSTERYTYAQVRAGFRPCSVLQEASAAQPAYMYKFRPPYGGRNLYMHTGWAAEASNKTEPSRKPARSGVYVYPPVLQKPEHPVDEPLLPRAGRLLIFWHMPEKSRQAGPGRNEEGGRKGERYRWLRLPLPRTSLRNWSIIKAGLESEG